LSNLLRTPCSRPDRWLQVPGRRLRFRDEGGGSAFVLVHGWALALEYWDGLAAALSSEHRVLRFDRRGFGESPGPADLRADARDLVSLLDAAGIERAVVVGMSQGARVALLAALEHPARVRAIVLDGAPADPLSGDGYSRADTPVERYREQLMLRGPLALRREIAASPMFALVTPDARIKRSLYAILERYSGRDLLDTDADLPLVPRSLAELGMPALVLTGEHDPRSAIADSLQGIIPRARRATIPASGHLCALERPQAYRDALSAFLADLDRTATDGVPPP
jgi:pimeloyl-ACP methyl ester carboxylesterase